MTISNITFRKILNDMKRRQEDEAKNQDQWGHEGRRHGQPMNARYRATAIGP